MSELRKTPLHDQHQALGARMVDFAGFAMPVQYTSIKQEHAAVRERAGLFDVSHMGQIEIAGPGAVECAEKLLTCPIASLRPGRVRYGVLCNETGGCVDDVTVYRKSDTAFFLCVNAANVEKDFLWIKRHAPEAVTVIDQSDQTALLALQGPASASILDRVSSLTSTDKKVSGLGRFRFAAADLSGHPVQISRTGYTGADGFEIYLPAESAASIFETLMDAGRDDGLETAGLGARDTLRLEAALPLYGHELDDSTSPLEAGLDRFIKSQTGGFLGAEAIQRREEQGRVRQLVGFVIEGRGIPRGGYPIALDGTEVGSVTSGGPSPTLGSAIGLGYVPPELAAVGTEIDIVIRDRSVQARVVKTPFIGAA
ncbi:MAG: glycine cleavage system protein T [bacterium TMED88]|nr:glycine cleavage system protein T [Deltaproteobacteria bacterium]OUV31594.1 MAG: glycine cleavage system protein T [bacterium TMED88]